VKEVREKESEEASKKAEIFKKEAEKDKETTQ
jgi:hypothetical protein